MKIRKANIKDLKRIIKLFKKEYAKPPYNENWTQEIANIKIKEYFKSSKIFVIVLNNVVQGFIIVHDYQWHVGLRGFIDELVVNSKVQGRGYGKMLLGFVENYFKDKNAKEISLISSPKSIAFNIYKKLNYNEEKLKLMVKKIK